MAAQLAAHAPLTALVGQRVYPVKAPPNAPKPYAVWSRTDTDPEPTLTAGLATHTADFELEFFAATYAEAQAAARAGCDALTTWEGEPPAAIMSATLAAHFDDYDEAQSAHRAARSFAVLHRP